MTVRLFRVSIVADGQGLFRVASIVVACTSLRLQIGDEEKNLLCCFDNTADLAEVAANPLMLRPLFSNSSSCQTTISLRGVGRCLGNVEAVQKPAREDG